MKGVAGLAVDLCDLAEAEGRLLRESVRLTGLGCALALVGIVFLAGGLALVVAAAWQVLRVLLPEVWALLFLGFLCVFIALAFLWSANKCLPHHDSHANHEAGKDITHHGA